MREVIEDGVEVIDFYPIFVNNKDNPCLFSKEHHISAFGAKIVGQHLAEYIKKITRTIPDRMELGHEKVNLYCSDYGNPSTWMEPADVYYFESSLPIRRHQFRYSKCAQQTFIDGGAAACGRMEVYLENRKTYFWNQDTEKSRIAIFGDCNLQSYCSHGAGISANLSYVLKYPVHDSGRKLIFGFMERPILRSELDELLKYDLLIYVNFASAAFVRSATLSLRYPAIEYHWCNFDLN